MIEVKDLRKSFGDLQVLKGISETINEREVVCVIGPSGSGKSTFLRCLNLLEEPSGGEIFLDDKKINDPNVNIDEIREKLGMVFQSFNLFPHMTVLDNLTLAPIKVKGMEKSAAEEKARKLLETVGLADKAEKYPASLSGGQKQRVAIARALAMVTANDTCCSTVKIPATLNAAPVIKRRPRFLTPACRSIHEYPKNPMPLLPRIQPCASTTFADDTW